MKRKIIFIGVLTLIIILLYIIYNLNYEKDLNYSFGGGNLVEPSTQINSSLGEE